MMQAQPLAQPLLYYVKLHRKYRRCQNGQLICKESVGPHIRHQRRGSAIPQALRVFCVSDIHTDYLENMHWATSLSDKGFG